VSTVPLPQLNIDNFQNILCPISPLGVVLVAAAALVRPPDLPRLSWPPLFALPRVFRPCCADHCDKRIKLLEPQQCRS